MTSENSPIIVWIRKDLRLSDNPALAWAATQKKPLIIAVIANTDEQQWKAGAASRWWLHHSLDAYAASLSGAGGRLRFFSGHPETVLQSIIAKSKASAVVWNRRYEPDSIALDKQIKEQLSTDGVMVKSFHGNLCREPWHVQKNTGQPYRVFTAYWRASLKTDAIPPTKAVRKITDYARKLPGEVLLEQLDLLPGRDWADAFTRHWQPGEKGAQKQLRRLIGARIAAYQVSRDIPAVDGTSALSPHLAFGEISPRTVYAAITKALTDGQLTNDDNTEAFLREIGWREFAYHLLYHFPQTPENPLDSRFENFPWLKIDQSKLEAWKKGNTGIPLVDAGMRQLWATGWMHNRVRMVVGSLLIKNMGYHWLEGARWFWDTLVDADLASNTMGWQWVAGSGADAAPYFRVFNPVRQGERFDKEGKYVRKWIPEIARLSDKYIHSPWSASDQELSSAGIILGRTYPHPIVDLSESRKTALARFDKIKR